VFDYQIIGRGRARDRPRILTVLHLRSFPFKFKNTDLKLPASFKGDVMTPDGDEGYTQAIARVGRQLNAERKARVVSFGKDTGDIGNALKYARAGDLQVGIRCGSHSH
jgi:hypothetical protein